MGTQLHQAASVEEGRARPVLNHGDSPSPLMDGTDQRLWLAVKPSARRGTLAELR